MACSRLYFVAALADAVPSPRELRLGALKFLGVECYMGLADCLQYTAEAGDVLQETPVKDQHIVYQTGEAPKAGEGDILASNISAPEQQRPIVALRYRYLPQGVATLSGAGRRASGQSGSTHRLPPDTHCTSLFAINPPTLIRNYSNSRIREKLDTKSSYRLRHV